VLQDVGELRFPAGILQNGAVIPKVVASRPPSSIPIPSPPTIATRWRLDGSKPGYPLVVKVWRGPDDEP